MLSDHAPATDPKLAPRILLADDDPRLLKSLARLLKLNGIDADTARGGAEAVERLDKGDYDLLLLDLRMPGISGHDVMQHMLDAGIRTMTVVVSGESSPDDISRALRKGAYDYLRKPYAPDQLLATVNNAISKKRLEDSNVLMLNRLHRSEKMHRFIVENSPDLIFMLDEQARFSFLNSSVESLLGYPRAQLLGQHITSLIEAPGLEKVQHLLGRALREEDSGRPIEVALKPLFPARTKRWFELALWPMAKSEKNQGSTQCFHSYGTARDITDRMEAEAVISFQAHHDLLTRLPNRILFKDRVGMAIVQAQRDQSGPVVMFIDLDRFKLINDSLGHAMGDRVLQIVAERLLGCIRKGDTLSRFGGDEFTLLLPAIGSPAAARQVAGKILESMRLPIMLDGHELHIAASIGIAIYPSGGTNVDALTKNADIAMYRAKRTGKDGYQLFSPEMSDRSQRLSLEQDLRRALETDDQIEIHYQAQVDTVTRQLRGVEALVRWNHPEHGQLLPSGFVPVAEDSGLILEMDRLTLQRACRQIRNLHQRGWPDLRLAVNISPLLIERENFSESILAIIAQEDFPPSQLELEITESLLMHDRPDVIAKLRRLQQTGIRIAIDDFGTGYSSLSYLHKFPISTLKIDRSFIQNIKNPEEEACIVGAIVAMADGLKLQVVAEGVESPKQLKYLRSIGCPVVQGYLFGLPCPLEELMSKHGAASSLGQAEIV